jgi:uncharacterized damage-inducible protein DinB
MNPLLETWAISASMNEYLLKGVPETHLKDIATTKGRNIGEQFAHIHNVRLMWIKAAMPNLLVSQRKFEKENPPSKNELLAELNNSAKAIEQLITNGIETGKVKGFKPHVQAFVGYIVAHEAHHRGQIIQTLKQNGHLPDKKVLFGLWEWGTKK